MESMGWTYHIDSQSSHASACWERIRLFFSTHNPIVLFLGNVDEEEIIRRTSMRWEACVRIVLINVAWGRLINEEEEARQRTSESPMIHASGILWEANFRTFVWQQNLIGFLAWARYALIDLKSICKRSQLRDDNIRLYQGLPLAASVILEDHFLTLHDRIWSRYIDIEWNGFEL